MLLYALNEGIMVSGDYKNRRDYTGLVSVVSNSLCSSYRGYAEPGFQGSIPYYVETTNRR